MNSETKLSASAKAEMQRVFDIILLDEPLNFLALYGKSLSLFKEDNISESLETINKAISLETADVESNAKQIQGMIEKVLTVKAAQFQIGPGLSQIGFHCRKPENLFIKSLIMRQPNAGQKNSENKTSPAEPKRYNCKVCDKNFTKMFSLNRHTQLHTGVKAHKCSFCRKAFIQKTDMERHETTHSEVLNFSCTFEDCEKRFRTKKNLNCHLVIHSTERPFKCKFCPKDFKVKRLLNFHEGLHLDFKPFNCDICGKGFPAKPYIKSHLKTHMDEKPFSCSVCKIGFKRRYDLHYHIRSQHEKFTE